MKSTFAAEAIAKKCKTALIDMFGKDASQSDYFGRLVNDRAWVRVKDLIDDSTSYVSYGGNYKRDEKYVEPTLLDFKTALLTIKFDKNRGLVTFNK